MNTRKIVVTAILTVALVALGTFAYHFLGNKKAPVRKNFEESKVLRVVDVKQYVSEDAKNNIVLDGRLNSFQSVNLFSKVTGQLSSSSKAFKKGTYYKKGELLFDIDQREARYNLFALRSNLLNQITQIMPDLKLDYPQAFQNWKQYLDAFDVEASVKELPKITNDQEKYYVASKNIYNTFYSIKSNEARLADYQIYAPFSGVVTAANVFEGSMISPGLQLGTLTSTGYYELEAPISESQMQYVKVGQRVALISDITGKQWTGKVNRISSTIDPATQSIPLFIGVSGAGLKEGMYLKGNLSGTALKEVAALPKNIIVNQEYVYTVQDSIVNQTKLDIVSRDDEHVYVTGLDTDMWVVKSTPAGLFDGQKVNPKRI